MVDGVNIEIVKNIKVFDSRQLTKIVLPNSQVQNFSYEFQRELCFESGYFESDYYRNIYPDIVESNSDPLEHFLIVGFKEGRNPNPAFDTSHYMSKYGKELDGMNPLIHYLLLGNDLNYSTHSIHPLVSKYYPILKLYFNAEGYFSDVEKAITGYHPLEHYLKIGYLEERQVNPIFDKEYYEEKYPESINYSCSFLHFINEGELSGCRPNPLFDYEYYETMQNQDRTSKYHFRPIADFLIREANEFISPCQLFDGEYYRKENIGVLSSDLNPFSHYVSSGFSELIKNDPHPFFSLEYYHSVHQLDHHVEAISHYLHLEELDNLNTTYAFDARSWYRDKMALNNVSKSEKPILNYLDSDASDKDSFLHYGFTLEKEIVNVSEYYKDLTVDPNNIHFDKWDIPKVTIIIPNYNQAVATLKCLHSITKAKNETSFEVVLIDDASSDLDTEKFTALKGIQLIRNRENLGYIQSCNKGATFAKGEFIVQLNNDTLVLDNWLDSLVGTFETFPNVGLVGGLLVFPDASIQEAGGVIWSDAGGLNFGRGAKVSDSTIGYPRKVDYCSGACILLKKTLWDELEGYDSLYAPAYYEDTDLAFRVREVGLHVYYQPRSTIIHLEGLSSGTDESTGTKRFQIINKEKFYNRWKKQLKLHTHENYKDRYCIGNVLFIDAYTPTPDRDSGSQDIMNYMQFFQDCGYKASFLPMMNMVAEGEYTRNLQDKGIEWIGAPSYNTPNEYLSLEGAKYDLVIFYRAHATYVLIDFVRQTCPNAKVIYETVDLHHLRHLREAELNNDPYQFHVANTVKRQEISNILKSDATILLSNYEYDYLKQVINPELLHVIPIARACIGTQVGYQDRQNILFLGGFSHTPNIDCLRYLAEEIMPILLQKDASICLRVVGADITQEILDFACQNIVIDGYIEDLSEVFDSVRMLVAPLRIGAGMKGKVVSALTHALPCVISEIAAEGMNIANYDGVIIENSAEKIVEAILKLYSDSKFWSDMSSTGFAFAQERFSLVGTYDKLYNLIHELSLPIPNDFENIKSTLKI